MRNATRAADAAMTGGAAGPATLPHGRAAFDLTAIELLLGGRLVVSVGGAALLGALLLVAGIVIAHRWLGIWERSIALSAALSVAISAALALAGLQVARGIGAAVCSLAAARLAAARVAAARRAAAHVSATHVSKRAEWRCAGRRRAGRRRRAAGGGLRRVGRAAAGAGR